MGKIDFKKSDLIVEYVVRGDNRWFNPLITAAIYQRREDGLHSFWIGDNSGLFAGHEEFVGDYTFEEARAFIEGYASAKVGGRLGHTDTSRKGWLENFVQSRGYAPIDFELQNRNSQTHTPIKSGEQK